MAPVPPPVRPVDAAWRFTNQPLVVCLLCAIVGGVWNACRLLDDSVKFQKDFAQRLERIEGRVTTIENRQDRSEASTDKRLTLLEAWPR
jgi:hypothetical protein